MNTCKPWSKYQRKLKQKYEWGRESINNRKWKYQREKESESTNKEEKVKVPTKKRKWKYQLERECREREGERPLPAACSLCSLAPWRISSSSLMMDNIRKYKWKSKKYVTCPPIESGSWALHQHFQQSQSRSGPSSLWWWFDDDDN